MDRRTGITLFGSLRTRLKTKDNLRKNRGKTGKREIQTKLEKEYLEQSVRKIKWKRAQIDAKYCKKWLPTPVPFDTRRIY